MNRLLALFISAAFTATVAAQRPTHIRVRPVIAKELPSFTEKEHRDALTRAGTIIEHTCGIAVEFELLASTERDEFLAERAKAIAPYKIGPDLYWDPWTTDEDAYKAAILKCCQAQKDLAHLKELIGEPDASVVDSIDRAAKVLLKSYVKSQSKRLDFTIGGENRNRLVKDRDTTRYAYGYWGVYMHSMEWTDAYSLIIANIPLVTDGRDTVNPLTLANGSVAGGTTLPASRSALVAYGPITMPGLAEGGWKLGDLSRNEMIDAVAYMISHYVGVALLKGLDQDEFAKSGLIRPIQVLRDKRLLTDLAAMRLPDRARPINSKGSYTYKVFLRMDILLAQKEWERAIEESKRADNPLFDAEAKEQIEKRVALARKRLEIQ